MRALRFRETSPVNLSLPPSFTCVRAPCPAAQCCWAPLACAGLSAQHVASRSRRARGRVAGAGAAAWVARRQAGGTRVRVAPAAARARPGDAMSRALKKKKGRSALGTSGHVSYSQGKISGGQGGGARTVLFTRAVAFICRSPPDTCAQCSLRSSLRPRRSPRPRSARRSSASRRSPRRSPRRSLALPHRR